MSVTNFLFRQTDVGQSSSHPRNIQNQNSSQLDRPLSVYDNIKTETTQINYSLAEIKFRFDESPLTTVIMRNTSIPSAVHCNNISKQTTTLPVHKYENVHVALQMRNKRESDHEVETNQNDEHSAQQRSVMSVAKSSFFGLNGQQTTRPNGNYDGLTEDESNTKSMSSNRHLYMNVLAPQLPNELKVQSYQEKASATSSASGSSSTTVTPSSGSPIRERTENGRKNSDRSKSPKFMLPEASCTLSPSQVNYPQVEFGVVFLNVVCRANV